MRLLQDGMSTASQTEHSEDQVGVTIYLRISSRILNSWSDGVVVIMFALHCPSRGNFCAKGREFNPRSDQLVRRMIFFSFLFPSTR